MLGGSPHRRISTLSETSLPRETETCGRLGMPRAIALNCSSDSGRLSSCTLIRSPAPFIPSIKESVGVPIASQMQWVNDSGWKGEMVGGSDAEGFSTSWFIPSRRFKSAPGRASSVWRVGEIIELLLNGQYNDHLWLIWI